LRFSNGSSPRRTPDKPRRSQRRDDWYQLTSPLWCVCADPDLEYLELWGTHQCRTCHKKAWL
jgi:hypothetical protein